jgi:hypothetical protein
VWADGNSAGNWSDPVATVAGLVLIAALFVSAIALLVGYVSAAIDGGEDSLGDDQ